MSDEVKTAEDIAQDFTAMGHSVELINGIIDSSKMADESAEDRQACVDRNVEHLEIMQLLLQAKPTQQARRSNDHNRR